MCSWPSSLCSAMLQLGLCSHSVSILALWAIHSACSTTWYMLLSRSRFAGTAQDSSLCTLLEGRPKVLQQTGCQLWHVSSTATLQVAALRLSLPARAAGLLLGRAL